MTWRNLWRQTAAACSHPPPPGYVSSLEPLDCDEREILQNTLNLFAFFRGRFH